MKRPNVFMMRNLLTILVITVIYLPFMTSDCLNGKLHHCNCVNVSQSQLRCPENTKESFFYESLVRESSEEMTLKCGPNVNKSVLNDLELVIQSAGQSTSVKMVSCSAPDEAEMTRHCTPVTSVSIYESFMNFFSFSYTYTKGNTLRELDLVGCSDMENPESMDRIKTMMNADAISLFDFEGANGTKILKKYLYYGHGKFTSSNEKPLHKIEGLNIDLRDRYISKVQKEVFWAEENTYHIEMLDLTYNEISELPFGFFPNSTFSHLKYLDLSHNQLTSLHKDIFENLTSVADLNLAGNMLKMLSNGIFSNNPLERLDLSNNQLILLEPNILEKTLNLETLDLSNNWLTNYTLKSANSFRRLLTLNLANNALSKVESQWQIGYPTLRLLNVSHNNIGPVIIYKDLQYRKSYYGMVLDLSYNSIEVVDIREDSANIEAHNFQTINLEIKGNPLKCDCSATELKQELDGKLFMGFFRIISQRIVCDSGKSLQDIDYKDLNCPLEDRYPNQDCSQYGCNCTVNRYYKEVTINCSAVGMAKFPIKVIELPDPEYTINLDLSYNEITDFPKDNNITNYENIKVLNISGNKVEQVDHQFLPSNLTYLSLDNNKINHLTEETVMYFKKYINKTKFHMKMGDNPYDCNCNAEHLLNFLDSSFGHRVEDGHNVFLHCSRGPLELVSAKLEDFCTSIDAKLLPIIFIAIVLIAVLFFLFGVYHMNKQKILIYLYSKRWSRKFFHEDYIDKDKNYDVFISYSHADSEYVEKKLLRGLEYSPDSEFRYKVCVHSRDWNVGEGIPTQIFRSVSDSRKTIIVLSQNYVESKWSDMEFKAAHKKALIDKIQRVIIIKLGELSVENEMVEDLQNYMKMNTYLESTDPWFWPKLRYTLPHRRKVSAIGEKVFWSALEKPQRDPEVEAVV